MKPVPKCDVLNNFAGCSERFGSGGTRASTSAPRSARSVRGRGRRSDRQMTDLGKRPATYGSSSATPTRNAASSTSRRSPGLTVCTRCDGEVIVVGDTGNASQVATTCIGGTPGPTYRTPVDPVPLLSPAPAPSPQAVDNITRAPSCEVDQLPRVVLPEIAQVGLAERLGGVALDHVALFVEVLHHATGVDTRARAVTDDTATSWRSQPVQLIDEVRRRPALLWTNHTKCYKE